MFERLSIYFRLVDAEESQDRSRGRLWGQCHQYGRPHIAMQATLGFARQLSLHRSFILTSRALLRRMPSQYLSFHHTVVNMGSLIKIHLTDYLPI
jgi:hypothetical protein